jgi:hypothetical protein
MLQYLNNEIHQPDPWGKIKVLTMVDILNSHAPLDGEPLADRMAAVHKAVDWALKNPTEISSETARLQLDFWRYFQAQNIPEQIFVYKLHDGDGEYMELTMNATGLFYQGQTHKHSAWAPIVKEQLFSEFWFYGPKEPIPDLLLRKKVLERVKQGFANEDCMAVTAHFELFEYPQKSLEGLYWEEGDHVRTDFIRVSDVSIETGYWTFRDPPGDPGLLSFENFLHLPPEALSWISAEIRNKIEGYLEKTSKFGHPKPPQAAPKARTPREKMDLAEALLQNPNSDEGAEALIALLEYETESDYWRNYVFNRLSKLRDNPRVQRFVLDCLEGDNALWFKKAVDVLSAWGFFYGDALLADRTLLLCLNWDDATANDPDFRSALGRVQKIVLRTV